MGNIGGGGEWGGGDNEVGFVERLAGELLDAILPSGLDAVADEAIQSGLATKAVREIDSLFANASLNPGQRTVAGDVVAAIQDEIEANFPESDVESAALDAMPDGFEGLSNLVDDSVAVVDSYQDEALALSGEGSK
jgi:hypothetical protein